MTHPEDCVFCALYAGDLDASVVFKDERELDETAAQIARRLSVDAAAPAEHLLG